MADPKQPDQDTGLEKLSVNSSRRSGVKEDRDWSYQTMRMESTIQPRVPRCRISRYRSSSRQRSMKRRGIRPDQALAVVGR